jgi:hypothetical protein
MFILVSQYLFSNVIVNKYKKYKNINYVLLKYKNTYYILNKCAYNVKYSSNYKR